MKKILSFFLGVLLILPGCTDIPDNIISAVSNHSNVSGVNSIQYKKSGPIYGNMTEQERANNFTNGGNIFLYHDSLYFSSNYISDNKVYRYSKTGDINPIIDNEQTMLQVDSDKIYFCSAGADGLFGCASLTGENDLILEQSDAVRSYSCKNNKIYYIYAGHHSIQYFKYPDFNNSIIVKKLDEDIFPVNVYAVGEYIYFCSYKGAEFNKYYIYRMKENGTDFKQIATTSFFNIYFQEEYIYFYDVDKSCISRCRNDGTQYKKIEDTPQLSPNLTGSEFNIKNEYIYFKYSDKKGIYRTKIDGSSKIEKFSSFNMDYMYIIGSYMYGFGKRESKDNHFLYRINLSSNENPEIVVELQRDRYFE